MNIHNLRTMTFAIAAGVGMLTGCDDTLITERIIDECTPVALFPNAGAFGSPVTVEFSRAVSVSTSLVDPTSASASVMPTPAPDDMAVTSSSQVTVTEPAALVYYDDCLGSWYRGVWIVSGDTAPDLTISPASGSYRPPVTVTIPRPLDSGFLFVAVTSDAAASDNWQPELTTITLDRDGSWYILARFVTPLGTEVTASATYVVDGQTPLLLSSNLANPLQPKPLLPTIELEFDRDMIQNALFDGLFSQGAGEVSGIALWQSARRVKVLPARWLQGGIEATVRLEHFRSTQNLSPALNAGITTVTLLPTPAAVDSPPAELRVDADSLVTVDTSRRQLRLALSSAGRTLSGAVTALVTAVDPATRIQSPLAATAVAVGGRAWVYVTWPIAPLSPELQLRISTVDAGGVATLRRHVTTLDVEALSPLSNATSGPSLLAAGIERPANSTAATIWIQFDTPPALTTVNNGIQLQASGTTRTTWGYRAGSGGFIVETALPYDLSGAVSVTVATQSGAVTDVFGRALSGITMVTVTTQTSPLTLAMQDNLPRDHIIPDTFEISFAVPTSAIGDFQSPSCDMSLTTGVWIEDAWTFVRPQTFPWQPAELRFARSENIEALPDGLELTIRCPGFGWSREVTVDANALAAAGSQAFAAALRHPGAHTLAQAGIEVQTNNPTGVVDILAPPVVTPEQLVATPVGGSLFLADTFVPDILDTAAPVPPFIRGPVPIRYERDGVTILQRTVFALGASETPWNVTASVSADLVSASWAITDTGTLSAVELVILDRQASLFSGALPLIRLRLPAAATSATIPVPSLGSGFYDLQIQSVTGDPAGQSDLVLTPNGDRGFAVSTTLPIVIP